MPVPDRQGGHENGQNDNMEYSSVPAAQKMQHCGHHETDERKRIVPVIHPVQKVYAPGHPAQVGDLDVTRRMDGSRECNSKEYGSSKGGADVTEEHQSKQVHTPSAQGITGEQYEVITEEGVAGELVYRQSCKDLGEQMIRSGDAVSSRVEGIAIPDRSGILRQHTPLPCHGPNVKPGISGQDATHPLTGWDHVDQESRSEERQ